MREYVRQLIHHARQGTDAGRAGGGMDGVTGIETLAADAVRLARVAAAVHAGGAVSFIASETNQPATLNDRGAPHGKQQCRSVLITARDQHQLGGDLP